MIDLSSQPTVAIVDPFCVACYDEAMDYRLWWHLASTFPSDADLHVLAGMGNKNHFCDRDRGFSQYISQLPEWEQLHIWLLREFPRMCARVFGIDTTTLKAQFEWSALPGFNGEVRPHPDSMHKVATAVMFFNLEWLPEWGGAFEVLQHKTHPKADWSNRQPPWSEVETVLKLEPQPRRILFMLRTINSLHGVRPLKAPISRQTITVNLMRGSP